MKYDPIMCMMVDDTVKTKDGLDDPEKNAGYEMKKEGQYFKIYKNCKLIGMKSTEEEARMEAARHRAANDSDSTKDESYIVRGRKYKVLKREGNNVTVKGPDEKITKMDIDFLMSEGKKVSDALDKAITTCDKTEFDPQDISYIRKAIGTLKTANSLLGMINEGTVNKAKQNIANTISLLESID